MEKFEMDDYYYDEPYECPGVRDFRIDPDKRLKDTITKEELKRYPVLQMYIDAEEEEIKNGVKSNISENMITNSLPRTFINIDREDDISSSDSSTDYISDDYEDDDDDEDEDEDIDDIAIKEDITLTIDEKEEMDKIGCWISIKGYKEIKKQIVQKGLSLLDLPKNGDICIINFIATLEDGKIVDSGFNCKAFVGYRNISEVLYIYL